MPATISISAFVILFNFSTAAGPQEFYFRPFGNALDVMDNEKVPFMQHLFIVSFFLQALSIMSYSQTNPKFSHYLKDKNVSKAAKDFYLGKFKASDDDKTFSIIDSMVTKNAQTRPFYIYLFSKMMYKSDGALSEELAYRAKDYLEWHPNWALDFLQGNLVESNFKNDWAETIAGEFQIDCEGKEKACAKEWYNKTLSKTDPRNKKALQMLYQKVLASCP